MLPYYLFTRLGITKAKLVSERKFIVAKDDAKTAAPYSMRFTEEERATLETEAGRLPLAAHIRSRLFSAPTPRKRFKRPVEGDQVLSQLLVELGKSRIGSNLNQLAKACNSGDLAVAPETAQAIQAACADVDVMRQALLKALGMAGEA
jgi:hypothetical protein